MKKLMMALGACMCALGMFVGNDALAGLLPSGYTPLEYIESTGSQYIKPGILSGSLDENTSLELKFQMTKILPRANSAIFGFNWTSYGFTFGVNNSYKDFFFYGTGTTMGMTAESEHAYTLTCTNGTVTLVNEFSGSTSRLSGQKFSGGGGNHANWSLFGCAGTINPGPVRVRSLKMWQAGDPLRDLYPCVEESTQKVGLYDLVNGVFYGNGNTTGEDFVRGPEQRLEVRGAPGECCTVSPAYGFHAGYQAGDSVTCTANGGTAADGGYTAMCTGYTVYSCVDGAETSIASGTGATATFTHPGNLVKIVWNWNVNYRTILRATLGGSVAFSAGAEYTPQGGTLTLVATPEAGYRFVTWAGDLPDGVTATDATISFPATAARTIQAAFVPTDAVVCTPSDSVSDAITTAAGSATAENPGVVYLVPGTYTASSFLPETSTHLLILDAPVHVIGLGAEPGNTVIDGGDSRRIARLANADAWLENVTLAHARDLDGGTVTGFGIALEAGTATNCVLTAGYMPQVKNANEHFLCQTGGLFTDGVVSFLDDEGYNHDYGAGNACCLKSGAVMRNTLVTGNSCGGDSIVCLSDSGTLVENCIITKNTKRTINGTLAGGACVTKGATLRNSEISYNTVTTKGAVGCPVGGVYVSNGTVDSCRIFGNYELDHGTKACVGGVYMTESSVLKNSLVYGNKVAMGYGGVWMYHSNSQIISTTIAGNSNGSDLANPSGLSAPGGGVVKNTIVAGNFGNASKQVVSSGTFKKFTYNLFGTAVDGLGDTNLIGDPLFTNAENDDYSLQLASPARDTGAATDFHVDAWDPYIPAVDMVGTTRPQGAGTDRGCFERLPSVVPECGIQLTSATEGEAPYTLTATAEVQGGSATAYTWTIYDAHGGIERTITDQGATLEATFNENGAFTLGLAVAFGDVQVQAPVKYAFTVKPCVVYASLTGGNEFPYDTAAKAARNIQDAIDAVAATAENPGTCYVAPGIYTTANGAQDPATHLIRIEKPIRVVATGATREETVIDGENVRRLVFINAAGATFENFTLFRAKDQKGTAVTGFGITLAAGTVTNCVLASGEMPAESGDFEHYLYQTGGLVVDCVISNLVDQLVTINNSQNFTSGRACYLSNGAQMKNCLITGCNSGGSGVFYMTGASTLAENCAVTRNVKRALGNVAGGVQIEGSALFRGGEISYNTVTNIGLPSLPIGGAYLNTGKIENSRIIGNDETIWGTSKTCVGGVWMTESSILRNCLIASNQVKRGTGGVCIAHGNSTVESCTIAVNDNHDETAAASGLFYQGKVRNTIIAKNTGNEAQVLKNSNAGTLKGFSNNCVEGTDPTGDETTIHGDPLFKKPAKGDFRLLAGSPCLAAGPVLENVTTYLDGTPRDTTKNYDLGCLPRGRAEGLSLLVR